MQRSTAPSDQLARVASRASRFSGRFVTAIALATLPSLLLTSAPLWAQTESPAKKKGAATAKKQPKKKQTGKPPAAADGKKDAADAASDVSSRKRPAVMLIDNPLISQEKEEALKKEMGAVYSSTLRRGVLDNSSQELIRKWALCRVHALSIPEYRRERQLHQKRADLMREVDFCAQLQSKESAARQFREFACKEITDRAKELLDNNYYVRLNAVEILGSLNVLEPRLTDRSSLPVAYAPAAEVLLDVLVDRDQHPGIKIAAARGLTRIALLGEPNTRLKLRMVDSLVSELNDKKAHAWYQRRLAEALGAVDTSNLAGEPKAVDALSKALVDRERDWSVRCEAAKALGRTPLARGINIDVIAFEVARTCHEMSLAYNADPKKVPWCNCFWKLYLAFQPADDSEQKLYTYTNRRRKIGLLAQAPTPAGVKEPYDQICKVAGYVLRQFLAAGSPPVGKPLPKDTIEGLGTWLSSNEPTTKRIAPGLEPLRQMKTAAAEAVEK